MPKGDQRERVLRENERILAQHRAWLKTHADGAYEDGAVSHKVFLACDLDVTIVEPAPGGHYAVVQSCIMQRETPYDLLRYVVNFMVAEGYGECEALAYTRFIEVPHGTLPEDVIELALATLHEHQNREW